MLTYTVCKKATALCALNKTVTANLKSGFNVWGVSAPFLYDFYSKNIYLIHNTYWCNSNLLYNLLYNHEFKRVLIRSKLLYEYIEIIYFLIKLIHSQPKSKRVNTYTIYKHE